MAARNRRDEDTSLCSNTALLALALVVVLVGIVLVIVGGVKLHSAEEKCNLPSSGQTALSTTERECDFSTEALRVNLPALLDEVKEAYFTHNPDNVAWNPDLQGIELAEYVKTSYFPYDPDPTALKRKTDAAWSLWKKLEKLTVDEIKLKPREGKALAQAKHFLKHVFGSPYDVNYYAGDWLMGPNYFCWQPICYMPYDINAFAWHVKPHTYEDVQHVINTIMKHNHTFERYRKNVALGVQVGMVRSSIDCKAGLDAFKTNYRMLALRNKPEGVLENWYTKSFTEPEYLASLDAGVNKRWTKKHAGQDVAWSIREALIKGVGEPLLKLINYLENDHSRHCLPNTVASGLANLPVDYVYTDGVPDVNTKTTKVLPNGSKLKGTRTYRMILSYFTTTDITPEKIFKEGKDQLEIFMPQVIAIAKVMSGKLKESRAIQAFKLLLNASEQWHNAAPFPSNESDEQAYKTCSDPTSAQAFCPRRWAAVEKWGEYIQMEMSMIYPKIQSMFYFNGPKATAANCPIEMKPHYNPSNGAMFFQPSDPNCTTPSYFGLPFFLKEYGPKFQEWSVIGHEARPGHHTQMQGLVEHFRDKCGGVPRWLDEETSYIAFQEGWALYAENPLLSDDAELFKDDFLQWYGMLKWQVWRAVRLVVDTGLHYRGMTRTAALKKFEDYTWDTTDFAVKEVTRYQSDPGQATGYMLGRLALIKMRQKVKKALGENFNLADFHYLILSQGSAPIPYLQGHVDKFVACEKGEIERKFCTNILGKAAEEEESEDERNEHLRFPPRPSRRSYV